MKRPHSTAASIGRRTLVPAAIVFIAIVSFILGGRFGTAFHPSNAAGSVDDGSSPVRFVEGVIEIDLPADTVRGLGPDLFKIPYEHMWWIVELAERGSAESGVVRTTFADIDSTGKGAPRKAYFEMTSKVDGRRYGINLVKDGVSTFRSGNGDDVQRADIPSDVLMFASEHHKGIFHPGLNIFRFFVDPVDGLMRTSFVYSESFWQLLGYIAILLLAAAVVAAQRLRSQRRLLVEQNRSLMMARENERERLAAEIHDGPIQDAQIIARRFTEDDTQFGAGDRPARVGIADSMDQLVTTLRDICSELRPPVLYHFGLADAIRTRSGEYSDIFPDVAFELQLESIDDLPDDLRISFFRIAQEAMGNALKHAGAETIRVCLRTTEKMLVLEVEDDGVGFDANQRLQRRSNKHQGMSMMSHLANAVDGSLDIVSSHDLGTLIAVAAPLPGVRDSSERRTPELAVA